MTEQTLTTVNDTVNKVGEAAQQTTEAVKNAHTELENAVEAVSKLDAPNILSQITSSEGINHILSNITSITSNVIDKYGQDALTILDWVVRLQVAPSLFTGIALFFLSFWAYKRANANYATLKHGYNEYVKAQNTDCDKFKRINKISFGMNPYSYNVVALISFSLTSLFSALSAAPKVFDLMAWIGIISPKIWLALKTTMMAVDKIT